MARAIDKRIMLDLIIEAKKTDPETGPFSEWLAEYLVDHLPTIIQQNGPLTLEQLWEMDGDPVWVEGIKRWAIVKLNCKGVFLHTTSGEFEVDPLGRDKIYRRPPEGEA